LSDQSSKLHIWVPDLVATTGGIQAFCQHFIDALQPAIPSNEARILVKNDSPDRFDQHDGNYPIQAYGNWTTPWRTPAFALQCLHQAVRERPQLIIAMHLHFGPLAQIVHQTLGIPYVLIAYGIEAWQSNSLLRQKALQKADLVLAISRHTREWLIQEGRVQAERVQLLAPTFSQEQFSVQPKPERLLQKYGLTLQTPVLLTVCRLSDAEQYKGYDQIVCALPRILRDLPETRYLLVGTGPDRARVERLAKETGVEKAVIFAGFVPNEELADYYNLCDVFAMPSKGEGFGIVYLEALACGKPVLAGNQDGSRDALADGELGVLVDADKTNEIAEQLLGLLRRKHPQENLFHPDELRRRVIELFGFETFRRTVIDRLHPFLSSKESLKGCRTSNLEVR
jgi:glycosyltransferase involved in cell wall biosynthesis